MLDRGRGPGRIAVPLAGLGHAVTGVDNGDGMIAALPSSVRGVVWERAGIRLGSLFDAVLLASHLVNDPVCGAAFAVTARAHLAPGGVVIGQTYPPGWDPTAAVGTVTRIGEAEIEMLSAVRDGELLDAVVRYGVDGAVWEQRFSAGCSQGQRSTRSWREPDSCLTAGWSDPGGSGRFMAGQRAPAAEPGLAGLVQGQARPRIRPDLRLQPGRPRAQRGPRRSGRRIRCGSR